MRERLRFCAAAAPLFRPIFTGLRRGERRRPLHDRGGVIRFQHRRKISSILIRNTVVPTTIRTTLGSCLAIEGVKSPKTRSCYEHHPPWTFKDGANGGGPRGFPGRRNRSHLETSGRRGRASRSPGPTRAKEKPTGLKRRARDLYRRCERGPGARALVVSGACRLRSAYYQRPRRSHVVVMHRLSTGQRQQTVDET